MKIEFSLNIKHKKKQECFMKKLIRFVSSSIALTVTAMVLTSCCCDRNLAAILAQDHVLQDHVVQSHVQDHAVLYSALHNHVSLCATRIIKLKGLACMAHDALQAWQYTNQRLANKR